MVDKNPSILGPLPHYSFVELVISFIIWYYIVPHYKRKYFTLVEVPIMKGILDTGRKRPKWSITPRKEEEIQELLKGKFASVHSSYYVPTPLGNHLLF